MRFLTPEDVLKLESSSAIHRFLNENENRYVKSIQDTWAALSLIPKYQTAKMISGSVIQEVRYSDRRFHNLMWSLFQGDDVKYDYYSEKTAYYFLDISKICLNVCSWED